MWLLKKNPPCCTPSCSPLPYPLHIWVLRKLKPFDLSLENCFLLVLVFMFSIYNVKLYNVIKEMWLSIIRAGWQCISMERMMYPDHPCIVVLLMLWKEAGKLSSYWVTHFWRVKNAGALQTLQVGTFLHMYFGNFWWDKCHKAILHGFNSLRKIFLRINWLVEKKGIALLIFYFVHPSHPMAWVADYCTNTRLQ